MGARRCEAEGDYRAVKTSERAMAGYGFEEGIDAEYFKDYAPEALKKAEIALGLCSRLVKTLFGGGKKKS